MFTTDISHGPIEGWLSFAELPRRILCINYLLAYSE